MSSEQAILQYVIPVVIATLIAAIVNMLPYFRARKDTGKEAAESAKAYADTADKFRDIAERQQLKLLEMDSKIGIMEQCMANLRSDYEQRINTLEREIESLKDWAKRLCGQVSMMGGTPVVFSPEDANKRKVGADRE